MGGRLYKVLATGPLCLNKGCVELDSKKFGDLIDGRGLEGEKVVIEYQGRGSRGAIDLVIFLGVGRRSHFKPQKNGEGHL